MIMSVINFDVRSQIYKWLHSDMVMVDWALIWNFCIGSVIFILSELALATENYLNFSKK